MAESVLLFKNQFRKDEWGGVNEAHRLSGGRIGLLAHLACME
ncbi:DUF1861 family protein [Paenibacillus humicola]|nr:DUF1861 family protein [Paenibacillus humicola]